MRTTILKTKSWLSIFFEFVEIRTKIASMVPLFLGLLWSFYAYQSFRLLPTLILFIAVLSFDMATTAINNTLDYKKAKSDEYKVQENVIGQYQLNYSKIVSLVFGLLGIALTASLSLLAFTNFALMVMGGICFFIGICYTFGPTPISRSPYGEFFSGLTMGFGITFIVVYVQNPQIVQLSLDYDAISGQLHLLPLLETGLIAAPIVFLIANIMLANNLCDYKMDLVNDRRTLVYYIQPKRGILLYQVLSVSAWLFWLLSIFFGLLPWWQVIAFVGIYPHWQSVLRFREKQVKSLTFIEAIKSFKLFSALYLLCLLLAIFLA